jgi:Delta7-sterol 5-desaturase
MESEYSTSISGAILWQLRSRSRSSGCYAARRLRAARYKRVKQAFWICGANFCSRYSRYSFTSLAFVFYDVFGEGFGLGIDLLILAGIIIAHDAYFYWAHRTMHHPKLFKTFHRAHHRSVTPTPWAAYSFAMPEAAVMFMFVPIWQFLVPTPGWVMFVWLNFQIIRNAMGHAGFEFFPRWWLSTPLTSWINTTVHHDLHHNGGFNTNYGLYFTWWDKWMGTEHKDYHARFVEVVGRGREDEPEGAVTA